MIEGYYRKVGSSSGGAGKVNNQNTVDTISSTLSLPTYITYDTYQGTLTTKFNNLNPSESVKNNLPTFHFPFHPIHSRGLRTSIPARTTREEIASSAMRREEVQSTTLIVRRDPTSNVPWAPINYD